ncbi:MAG: nucleotidyltransferase family protein [Actinobacteria bacterium]|nr:nucleotidyltransferase family protein [Actinomycetota bacterium]
MDQQHVLRVLDALEATGIWAALEGGWGVDALLGRQSRLHRDLDIAVEKDDLAQAIQCLERLGFKTDHDRKPGLPAKLVMVATDLGEVDVHPIIRDAVGNGWQQLSTAGAWGLYSAEGLRGVGLIGTNLVRCTTPELQVRHRLGYPLRQEDVHDLRLLRERFGVSIHPSCDDVARSGA